jgi:putative transposase
VQDRDHNAASNILKKGLNTVGHTGIKAWGENDLYLNQAIVSDKLAR